MYPGFADAPGYRTINTLKAGALSQLTAAAQRQFSSLTWKDLVEGGHVIAGSPDTVRERMEDMIKGLRIGTVFGLFHVGNMPDWKTRYSTQLFAEKVMPQPAEHVARVRERRPLVVQAARHPARPARDGRRPGPFGAGDVSALDAIQIDTRQGHVGATCYQGGSGPDLLFLHGAGGVLGAEDPFLLRLAESFTGACTGAPRLRRVDGRGAARGHARLHAPRLGLSPTRSASTDRISSVTRWAG